MKKIYNSKIGLEFVIPLILVLGAGLLMNIMVKTSWLGTAILLSVIIFVVHLFITTNYTIENGKLTIKCGFLYNKTIDIKEIEMIAETNNPLSSPATSLDRLEIKYGKFDSVLISPKEKKEFISDIKALNPNVEVRFKKKTGQL